ncbi:hypothetical protein DSM25558_1421 [Agrobacterium sp. DSM 25558]|uniref:Uncharacterized protein n=1 Tax=Agrobacterium rosae TaxID=1972867 RepID=A0A1R3TM02_9HYPH|nr:hypothetical protein DSM25558_1421 [Agrobacterium sp. DSM 25558]SCX23043.1 hypothetical protein DSM25559_2313 [Agrobacterium rosae]
MKAFIGRLLIFCRMLLVELLTARARMCRSPASIVTCCQLLRQRTGGIRDTITSYVIFAWLRCNDVCLLCARKEYVCFIEVMHLLPQSFDFRRPTPPPKGRLSEQRHSSSQPLFGSFRKACRTSSRGRLFRFKEPKSRRASF